MLGSCRSPSGFAGVLPLIAGEFGEDFASQSRRRSSLSLFLSLSFSSLSCVNTEGRELVPSANRRAPAGLRADGTDIRSGTGGATHTVAHHGDRDLESRTRLSATLPSRARLMPRAAVRARRRPGRRPRSTRARGCVRRGVPLPEQALHGDPAVADPGHLGVERGLGLVVEAGGGLRVDDERRVGQADDGQVEHVQDVTRAPSAPGQPEGPVHGGRLISPKSVATRM